MLLHGIDLRLRQPSGGRRGGGRSRNPTDPTYFPSSPSSPPLSLFLYLSLSFSLVLYLSLSPAEWRPAGGWTKRWDTGSWLAFGLIGPVLTTGVAA